MQDKNTRPLNFSQTLRLYSYEKSILSEQQVPIYQTSQIPYDFYLSVGLNSTVKSLEFFRQIANLGKAMVEISHVELVTLECNFLQTLMGKRQTNAEEIRLYMKYYNFSLDNWIQLKKNSGAKVSQEEFNYVLKNLLPLAVAYRQKYHQSAQVFHSKNIFLTNTRRVVLYPTVFKAKVENQEVLCTQRDAQSNEKPKSYVRKQESIGTTYSSESTLQSSRVYQSKKHSFIDEDLRDIFLIALELLTFKPKEFFFSTKHSMLKFDLAYQYIKNKDYTGHLRSEFVCVLLEVLERKVHSCEKLLHRVQDAEQRDKEVVCLGKATERPNKIENADQQVQQQRQKKISKTVFLNEIIPIKKCNSVQ